MNGDEPAAVSLDVIGALRAREDDKGFVKLERRPLFAPGDKVRVLSGAFIDNLGLFEGAGRPRSASPSCSTFSAARCASCSTRIWWWPPDERAALRRVFDRRISDYAAARRASG